MQTFLLKILPYAISLLGGAVIYLLSVTHFSHLDIHGLIVGIASGLLSIPLIFICYEGISKVASRRLHRTLFEHLSFDVNALIIELLQQVTALLGHRERLCARSLEALLQMPEEAIRAATQPDADVSRELRRIRDELLLLIQRHGQPEVLGAEEVHTLLTIRKEAGTIAREITHQLALPQDKRSNEHLAANMSLLLQAVASWLEQCETEALSSHRHFRFLSEK